MTKRVGVLLLAFVTACSARHETDKRLRDAIADGGAEADRDGVSKPPNVVFIAIDDLRPELGAYGVERISSPNIDRLAEKGLTFERAYAQQALCSPSRTSLLTGLRPDASQVWDQQTHFRDTVPDVTTLPQFFRSHGYHSEWWGKVFHGSLLDDESWTQQGDRLEPHDNWRGYVTEEARRVADANEGWGPPFERADVEDGAYPDGQVADAAVGALGRLAEAAEPFFLALGFYKPHLPFNAPSRYWDLYDPDAIELPQLDHPPRGAPAQALGNSPELRAYAGVPKVGPVDDELARELVHGYRACVSYVDAQVGRVLAELARLGIEDDTIVVLWGDHGFKLGEYGGWSKRSNFDVDTRAPLIVSAPWLPVRDRSTSALVELIDVYPTLAELAGLNPPRHLQGRSLVPLLIDPDRSWPYVALSQHLRNGLMGQSLRTDRYRFTEWRNARGKLVAHELYDYGASPLPSRNLAADDVPVELMTSLAAMLEQEWTRSFEGFRGRVSGE